MNNLYGLPKESDLIFNFLRFIERLMEKPGSVQFTITSEQALGIFATTTQEILVELLSTQYPQISFDLNEEDNGDLEFKLTYEAPCL